MTASRVASLFREQVNASGTVIRSEILGAVKMKCYLSGMPELRLGLNDKVMFENTGRGQSFRTLVNMITRIHCFSCSQPRKVDRDGRCQVPSMCPFGSI